MTNRDAIVLAIYPIPRGYGFVLFESASAGTDWGIRFVEDAIKTRNERTMPHIEKLLDRYHPEFLILQDFRAKAARRTERLKRLHQSIMHAAQVRFIEVALIGVAEIRNVFRSVGASSSYEIAQAVARQFPPLSHRLPPKPRAWDSVSPVMAVFRAAAMALTFYARDEEMSA